LAWAVFRSFNEKEVSQSTLADGEFEGGSGQWPRMVVIITVKKGKLEDIEVVENESDDQYIDVVLDQLPDAMVIDNTWDVDVVSGASLTSYSLMQAVRAALRQSALAAIEGP
jgi:uncharacterized protein with FMN-binding domain